jgi:hypothetical protein
MFKKMLLDWWRDVLFPIVVAVAWACLFLHLFG